MSADLDGSGGYSSARTSEGVATLYDPTGASHVFKDTGSGYVSPPEESGTLTKDALGALTLHADDGITYRFNADGTLASATSAADDRSPAAPAYTWTGSPARLTAITDPVSGRALTLRYGGDCRLPHVTALWSCCGASSDAVRNHLLGRHCHQALVHPGCRPAACPDRRSWCLRGMDRGRGRSH